jgi:hypothetical protein
MPPMTWTRFYPPMQQMVWTLHRLYTDITLIFTPCHVDAILPAGAADGLGFTPLYTDGAGTRDWCGKADFARRRSTTPFRPISTGFTPIFTPTTIVVAIGRV